MTIEQEAQKYNEALKRAEKLYEQGTITESLSYVFPELKESEDERIRKEILSFLKEGKPYHCPNSVKRQEWANWLEKQGEQKPAWSEEDEITRMDLINLVEMYYGGCIDKSEKNRLLSFLKSLKDRCVPQQQEWSEEDEYVYNEILKRVADKTLYAHDLEYIYKWLKSLRPQNRWKPSEEQIECLYDAIEHYNSLGYSATKLKELLDDLKKLREE